MMMEKRELKNVVGLRLSNAVIAENVFKVRNLIEILQELPNGTTVCGMRIEDGSHAAYLFFHNQEFPELDGKNFPFLEPQFKRVGSGKNLKLVDVGFPEHFKK